MSSSEEYLDNLLKALLEGENRTEPMTDTQESPEAMFASIDDGPEKNASPEIVAESEDNRKETMSAEANKAMSTDEIEEMLASMGESILNGEAAVGEALLPEDTTSEESVMFAGVESEAEEKEEELEALEVRAKMKDLSFGEEGISKGTVTTGSDDWALEEDSLPEETAEPDLIDDWALEEIDLPEEASVDEEETVEIGPIDDWALEEVDLPEEASVDEEETVEIGPIDDWALEEENLPEETAKPDLMDDWALEEDSLPEETAEPDLIDDWALEEIDLPEEASVDEEETVEIGPIDDWALEEDSLPEETAESDLMDGWALEEIDLQEEASVDEEKTAERGQMDDWALEEDSLLEETEEIDEIDLSGDWTLEELDLSEEAVVDGEDSLLEKTSETELIDDWALEEDSLPEETEETDQTVETGQIDDWTLEELDLSEEAEVDEEEPEDFEMQDWEIEEEGIQEDPVEADILDWNPEDDLQKEAAVEEEIEKNIEIAEAEDILSDFMTEEEKVSGEPEAGEPVPDDFSLMDLELNSLDEEDLDLENADMMADDLTMDSTMSEEDVDRLLGDDFALEESGEDDEGLSALLASMDQDEDLSAINDLLEKADQGLMEDDDMLSLLGDTSVGDIEESGDAFDFWGNDELTGGEEKNIQESAVEAVDTEIPDKKDKKKKGRKAGKKKGQKGNADAQDGMELTEGLLANMGDEGKNKKKQGAFSKLLSFLLEEEEDLSDDKENGSDSGLGSLSDENAELLAELNAEDKKNAGKKGKKKKESKKNAKEKKEKKPKKAKKPPKPKKEKKVSAEETGVPEKKISKTKIIFVCLFCSSVAACIIVVNMLIPDYMQKQEAREKYDDSQYEAVYDLLYGKELNEEEEQLLQKSNVILQINKKLKSYATYQKLDMQVEALNALIEGVEDYQMFRGDAELYGVISEADSIYAQILAELSGNYGVSEADALDILASEDDLIYSERVYGIIYGTYVDEEAEEQPKVKEDILPEEEEIIERLDNSIDSDSAEEAPEEDS